ncbi:MAG: cupin domain-containing protein [Candidatus Binatia bacterium]
MVPCGPTTFTEVRVPKPWGHETIWARTDRYVGKILHVRQGHALSLQYHRVKDETIRVVTGLLDFAYGPTDTGLTTVRLGPGDTFHVPPGLRHRMTALEDTDVVEVSTPELDDVVRIEDRYGRTP